MKKKATKNAGKTPTKSHGETYPATATPHDFKWPPKTAYMQVPSSHQILEHDAILTDPSSHEKEDDFLECEDADDLKRERVKTLAKTGLRKANLAIMIREFLDDVKQSEKKGDYSMTPVPSVDRGGWLLRTFFFAVTNGDAKTLRNIGDAVKRVHDAIAREQSAINARSRVLSHVEKNGPPQSLAETRRIMINVGGSIDKNLDEREVGRWHKDLGGAARKRGRPPKNK